MLHGATRTQGPWLLLATIAAVASWGGCGAKDANHADTQSARSPSTVTASGSPEAPPPVTGPSAQAPTPVVTATTVVGWQLITGPQAGVAYQYVRNTSTEPFRPTVTVVIDGPTDLSLEAYAAAQRERLRQSTPAFVVVAEQVMPAASIPLAKLVFQYERDQQKLQAMQLYFRRSNGEVVIVSFQSLVGQWDYLQTEFKQVLAAIEIAP